MSEFDTDFASTARPDLQGYFGDVIYHKPVNQTPHTVTAIIKYESDEERDLGPERGGLEFIRLACIKVVAADLIAFGRESIFTIQGLEWGVDETRRAMPEGSMSIIPLWTKRNIGLSAKGYQR